MEKDKYRKQTLPSFACAVRKLERNLPVRVVLSVLFNNIYGYIGLSFGGLGMVFVLVFTPMIDFVSPFYFGDDALHASGIVTDINPTNVSVNEATVMEYRYIFSYIGRSYTGVSYSIDHNYKEDQSVPVEFESDNPEISRIEGMRVQPGGLLILFIYIFPLIGLIFLFYAFKKGMPKIRTIRYGVMTRGRFLKMVNTGGSINEQAIYDLHFTFKDMSGLEHTAIGTTHKTGQVQDESEERILYDPGNPSDAVVVDAMPAAVRKFLSSVPG